MRTSRAFVLGAFLLFGASPTASQNAMTLNELKRATGEAINQLGQSGSISVPAVSAEPLLAVELKFTGSEVVVNDMQFVRGPLPTGQAITELSVKIVDSANRVIDEQLIPDPRQGHLSDHTTTRLEEGTTWVYIRPGASIAALTVSPVRTQVSGTSTPVRVELGPAIARLCRGASPDVCFREPPLR